MLLLLVNLVQHDETIMMVNIRVHLVREIFLMDLSMDFVEVDFHHDQTMELHYHQEQ
jgi:hypothetical protein